MAALTTHVVDKDGVNLTFVAAAAGGDDCAPGPGVVLIVRNGDVAAKTVTLVTPGVVAGDLSIGDRAVTVPASTDAAIPVGHLYRDPATGRASITYSAVTSVTVAVVRAPVS